MDLRSLDHQKHKTVMVVDNDEDLRTVLTTILDNEGIDVVTAGDGQEALGLLDEGEVPDLILTDMSMPGMNGSDFFSRLKSNLKTKDVPVIIISGMQDLEAKLALIGAKLFLKKPYDLDTLTTLVKRYLH